MLRWFIPEHPLLIFSGMQLKEFEFKATSDLKEQKTNRLHPLQLRQQNRTEFTNEPNP
jgi:hypothetical protein